MKRNSNAKDKKMKKSKKREHFNDLLLPVILLVAVLPFIIHLATVDTGFGQYLWYSQDGTIIDLYAYVRSHFLEIVGGFILVILAFYLPLYKEKVKNCKIFYVLAAYAVLAILSTIFAVNHSAALTGNLYRYEGLLVLLSYVLISFYVYQMMHTEKDYRTIITACLVMFAGMTMIGVFQVFKHDLLNYEWVQRLVMSAEDFEFYGGQMEDVFTGNNVFLTLFNPNYAGVFLTMFAAFFFVLGMTEPERKKKIIYITATVIAVILTWFTYSRSTLLALAAALVVYMMIRGRGQVRKVLRYVVPTVVVIAVVLVCVDAGLGFKYLSRFSDEKKDASVESIYTRDDGVWITAKGETIVVGMTDDGEITARAVSADVQTEDTITTATEQKLELTPSTEGEYTLPLPVEAKCTYLDIEGMPGISMLLNDYTLMFVHQDDTYYFYNENGNLDKMTEILAVDMHGLEYLGSGRLYIWSRTIPMLKDYLLIGSGPDTFAEAFPQNDYVGKMIYADLTSRVMEGAHNMYLTTWVQTGLLSLLALLVFYVVLIRKCVRAYGIHAQSQPGTQLGGQQIYGGSLADRVGFAAFLSCICYLAGGFFNDSTLYTTPVFCIFAGLALAGTAHNAD